MKNREKTAKILTRILVGILIFLFGRTVLASAIEWDPNTPFFRVQLNWNPRVANIVFDEEDNIYLSGDYSGPTAIPNHTTRKVFVAKFDSSGREQWLKKIGEGDNNQRDSTQLVYFNGIVYFLWRELVSIPNTAGLENIYLSRLNKNNGNEISNKLILNSKASAMTVDNNGIYIAHRDPNPYRSGSNLTKFDDELTTKIWILRMSGSWSGDYIFGMALDKSGNIYFGGFWIGVSDSDAIFGKYTQDKEQIWFKKWSTRNDDEIYSISLTESGLYGLGRSSHNGFLIKYDLDGNFLWSSEDFPELKELVSEIMIFRGSSGYSVNSDAGIIIENNRVYLLSYYKLINLDAKKIDNRESQGLIFWTIEKRGNMSFRKMAVNNNNLLIAADGYIYCFSAVTGEQNTYQPRSAVRNWEFYK